MMNVMQLIRSMQSGGNPMQMLIGMAKDDPQIGQVLGMVNGKTPAEMQRMVYDIAGQRGVDVNQLARQLGIRLPK